ncbi:MAG: hypothetical protein MPW16_12895 [Candidatus Manganitrophus sp.]|nr:MAG: hypothetical protein MPW16_12895 [Candidatus Manganitrophus sp.]
MRVKSSPVVAKLKSGDGRSVRLREIRGLNDFQVSRFIEIFIVSLQKPPSGLGKDRAEELPIVLLSLFPSAEIQDDQGEIINILAPENKAIGIVEGLRLAEGEGGEQQCKTDEDP